jgi:hypothetical protein
MRLFLVALVITLALVLAAGASAKIARIPHRCTTKPAARLCAIHFHKQRADRARRAMGRPRLPYSWAAEGHTALRDRLLTLWIQHQRHWEHVLADQRRSPSITQIIQRVFGPAASAAIRVAQCESQLNPDAHNASGASGLFQLMPTWWAGRYNPYDPLVNTRLAHNLYLASGWSDWTCQP